MKISNVILRIRDLDRSLEFYRDRLSMTVLGAGGAFAFLDGGGVTLALNEVGEAIDDRPPGMTEVVLEVGDVDAVYAELAAAGIEFRNPLRVVMSSEGRDLRAADFTDPDGNVLSITGWQEDGAS